MTTYEWKIETLETAVEKINQLEERIAALEG